MKACFPLESPQPLQSVRQTKESQFRTKNLNENTVLGGIKGPYLGLFDWFWTLALVEVLAEIVRF